MAHGKFEGNWTFWAPSIFTVVGVAVLLVTKNSRAVALREKLYDFRLMSQLTWLFWAITFPWGMENLAPLKLINGAPSALNDHSGPKWWLDLGVRVLFFGYSSKCAVMVPTPCLVLHLKQEKCGLVLCVTKIVENLCLFAATKSLVL